jgi:uncharacterized protein YndB with AHSA1/START domain
VPLPPTLRARNAVTCGGVRIFSEHRFRFLAPPAEVWTALSAVDSYPAWWPWLRRLDAAGLVQGDSWRCRIRPPLPYAIRCTIDLVTVEPSRLVAARIRGDILGRATISLRPAGAGAGAGAGSIGSSGSTDVIVTSALIAHALTARAGARLFPRAARRGHDWVFDTAARQFGEAHGWKVSAPPA